MIEKSNSKHVTGLSIYGGEPLDKDNQEGILHVIEKWKEAYPDKDIWLWTGYEIADLKRAGSQFTPFTIKILYNIDTIITGPFVEAKKNLDLAFRGSENQKIYKLESSSDGKKRTFKDVTSQYDI